jgi:hypothetical protein
MEKNIYEIRQKLKVLSKNLDKNYYEILNIYKELIVKYYENKKLNNDFNI